MSVENIAVLMTCHNRKEKTIECLTKLRSQEGINRYRIQIFLVDDGSQDGTGTKVREEFPEVRILQGNGTLFWCGGMRLAFGEALKVGYDFYLWLNDDTMLYNFALRRMLDTYYQVSAQLKKDAIIAGSVCDDKTHKLLYGGSRITQKWHPNNYVMIQPAQEPQRCDLFHGNCVLIPKMVASITGNMSDAYKHAPGDKDYAQRAKKCGFTSWICPEYIGTCSKNELVERWKNKQLSIKERVEALNHPVLRARVEDWIVYTRIYYKFLWPSFYIRSFIRLRFPRVYILLKSNFLFQDKPRSN